MVFQIESDGQLAAKEESVMVAYDNQADSSILIPVDWREKITQFENQEF